MSEDRSKFIPSRSHGVCITPCSRWDSSDSSSMDEDSGNKPFMVRSEECLKMIKKCLHARRENLANMQCQHNYMWHLASKTQNYVDYFENFNKNVEESLKALNEDLNGKDVPANSDLLDLYKARKEHKETLEESILEREAQIKDVECHYKELEVKIEREKKQIKQLEKEIKLFERDHDFTEDFDFALMTAQDEW